MRLPLFFLGFISLFTACQSPEPEVATVESLAVADQFGATFQPEEILDPSALLSEYSEEALTDTVAVTLRGEVNEVCQAKGCWMTLRAGPQEEMTVKFKDYGFFVPKDISGREVVMQGIAYYQITEVDELRHYAEDAGKSDVEVAAITQPRRELHFLADGVKLLEKS